MASPFCHPTNVLYHIHSIVKNKKIINLISSENWADVRKNVILERNNYCIYVFM